jgi:aspartate aminotransferase-like enzyme
MDRDIIHHRTPRFRAILKGLERKLKLLLSTQDPVLVLTSSGTGAMEAAVVNLVSAGDQVLVINGGKFGARFGEIAARYGVEVVSYDIPWGYSPDPSEVSRLLSLHPDIKVVYSTLCETSTGALSDIKALAAAASSNDAAIVVDAISGLTADELRTSEWGVDVVVCGSQKGLMLPPGLSLISVSERARRMMERSDLPAYYLDLEAALRSLRNNDTPWTPAISLVQGLDEALDVMLEEGFDNILSRHATLAEATREAVRAMGLEVFPQKPSNAVTAVRVPEGLDGNDLVSRMRDEHGITLAGGQAELKGRLFRIGHLGYMDHGDMLAVAGSLEETLADMGYDVEPGAGVSRMQRFFTGTGVRHGQA